MINVSKMVNGLRVATDTMRDVESVMVVLAVKVGSRHENAENNGISHFLEHMAFKGTKKRTALQIASEVDMVGGTMNAYTSKEVTLYYIKVIREHVELAFDIISDIICNSIFDDQEVEKEMGVILQELSASLDTPDDLIHNLFHDVSYKDTPLGMTILGAAENIKNFKHDHFVSYIKEHYHAGNMVLSVCGNITHEHVLNLSEKYFASISPDIVKLKAPDTAKYSGGEVVKNNPNLEQVQCILGFHGISYYDDRYYIMQLFSDILGSGMSSRLFQEVREKHGLVYTISSYVECYSDIGMLCIHAGVSPDKVSAMIDIIVQELKKISESILQEELQKVSNQVKSDLLMSLESTSARAIKLAKNILIYERYIPHSEILDKIKAVSIHDMLSLANEVFDVSTYKQSLALYGPVDSKLNFIDKFVNLV